MPRAPNTKPPLEVDLDRDCLLFCFSASAPLAAAALLLFESLVDCRTARPPPDGWLVFSGSGAHPRGLTAWVAVTADIPPAARDLFVERLDALGLFGPYEATGQGRPSAHPGLRPVLRLSRDGGEVLVEGDASPAFTQALPVRQFIPVSR